MHRQNNIAIVLLIIVAVAIVTTIAGRTSGRPGLMRVGLATLLVAVGKLFIVDLAIVDPIWRILLFIGFGAGLLAVAFWLNSDTEEKKNPTIAA